MTQKLTNASCISLLYHEVTDNAQESGFQNSDNLPYVHSVEDFVENLKLVKKQEIKNGIVTDLDLNNNEKHILFTFDDGGISSLNSSEILQKSGYKGHYFVTTFHIDHPLFVSRNDLKNLKAGGHLVGSHSHTHPMIFRELSYKKMLEQWSISKKILEDILGEEVLTCSIPGGDADEKTYDSAIESGYKYIFNSEPTSKIIERDAAYILGRFSIKNTTSLQTLENILLYKNHQKLQRVRKIKNTIKKIIFPIHSFLQNKKNIDA